MSRSSISSVWVVYLSLWYTTQPVGRRRQVKAVADRQRGQGGGGRGTHRGLGVGQPDEVHVSWDEKRRKKRLRILCN